MQVFFAKKIFKLNFVKSNILVRYIAKELLLYFLICFVFFFVVFFVNQILLLAETILKKRVPVNSVLKLILYCLPNVISQSAPFATLVGFLMCLGRLVTDNEILIFRASGQRYSLILKSVLVMGLLISVFSFIMNDYFLPIGTLKYNRLFKQIIVSNPAIELESKSIKRMNDSTLVIGNVNKNNVSDIVLFDSEKNGVQRIIMAENSDVKKSSAPGVIMQLDMNSPVVLSLDKSEVKNYESISAEKLRLNIFEDSIISSSNGTSPREMTSWDLIKRIKKMKQENSSTKKRLNTFILECNKKFSVPFGSFFFALLAFPLALIFGKKDGQTLGLIFGIILSVLYWSATIIGQMFGIRGGYNGFWMMWTPNFVIGILGIILYIRLKKK
ncbi:LptF/LptG family permease [uncultured Treponema sp.]|uniref:LptF/LptG family permease n=1 Tax=uncultured Treponema sp. TaxID=162155 RepID=UPI0026273D65|nr:LptF/LptG family permease [uncultured Treponema sp.]